jgi:hypothetical protein
LHPYFEITATNTEDIKATQEFAAFISREPGLEHLHLDHTKMSAVLLRREERPPSERPERAPTPSFSSYLLRREEP